MRFSGWWFSHRAVVAFVAILAIGVFLRVWQFPAVPVGLNQDEISAAYEAQSLLQTGADRWGARWPAYFLSWGSGQNVLYSYLTIPVIWLFGPTALTVRLIALICGIATLPLMYFTVRPRGGENAALLAMLFTALAPWHILLSRWGVESNILPFWLLLGLFLVERAARRNSRVAILFSGLPFALALYAYAVGAVVLALLIPLLVVSLRSEIRRRVGWWIGAAAVAAAVSVPFTLFILKSQVLHRNLPFEAALPFSLPSLSITRLQQLAHHGTPGGLGQFVLGQFYDNLPLDTVPGLPPLSLVILILALVGLVFAIRRAIASHARDMSPFALWLVACLPLFVVIPDIDDTRIDALFLPIIALAATGLVDLVDVVRARLAQRALVALSLIIVAATCAYAATIYFSPTYTTDSEPDFYPGFGSAVQAAARLSGDSQLYLSSYPTLGYMNVLWYLDIPPRTFQAAHPTPDDPDFGRFVFAKKRIDKSRPYFYLISTERGHVPCSQPDVLWTRGEWSVGRCG